MQVIGSPHLMRGSKNLLGNRVRSSRQEAIYVLGMDSRGR